ncbi:hypothetical protein [Paracoccus tibetensis]|uniref:Uncharacterized protein n=1 Tax=Paracoccus tibetensis TaxID=336292 RepID=A0A1G5BBB0_9RHOB|nr:hypothetical protein [Paracoccus tibetensis]SCX87413.1 hypothetical protein SAMN05660710_00072 [Paracoccus tibetensis]
MGTEYNAFTDTFSNASFSNGPAKAAPTYEVGSGGRELTFRTDNRTGQQIGTLTHDGGGEVRSSDFARGAGIERSILSPTGSPVMNRSYQPSDTVEVGGQRMALSMAANLGFVRMDGQGGYSFSGNGDEARASGAADEGQPQGQQDDAPASDTFRASDEAETALTSLTQTLPHDAQMAALNVMVETGDISQEMVTRMAERSGQDPAALAQQIEQTRAGFYDAVMSRMGGLGVHDDELFGQFVEGDPALTRQMQQAVRDMMVQNDASGFDGLAQKFTAALDRIDPDAVMDALDASGIKHRRGDGGTILMTLPGTGEVSYREAVRMGLVKVSRA